jgi:hypothetical protein
MVWRQRLWGRAASSASWSTHLFLREFCGEHPRDSAASELPLSPPSSTGASTSEGVVRTAPTQPTPPHQVLWRRPVRVHSIHDSLVDPAAPVKPGPADSTVKQLTKAQLAQLKEEQEAAKAEIATLDAIRKKMRDKEIEATKAHRASALALAWLTQSLSTGTYCGS